MQIHGQCHLWIHGNLTLTEVTLPRRQVRQLILLLRGLEDNAPHRPRRQCHLFGPRQ